MHFIATVPDGMRATTDFIGNILEIHINIRENRPGFGVKFASTRLYNINFLYPLEKLPRVDKSVVVKVGTNN